MNFEADNDLKFQNTFNNFQQNKNNEAQNNERVSRERSVSLCSSASSTLYIDERDEIERMCLPENDKRTSTPNNDFSVSSTASSILYIDEEEDIEKISLPENDKRTSTPINDFSESDNSFEKKFHQQLKILEDQSSKKSTDQNKMYSEISRKHVIGNEKLTANSEH